MFVSVPRIYGKEIRTSTGKIKKVIGELVSLMVLDEKPTFTVKMWFTVLNKRKRSGFPSKVLVRLWAEFSLFYLDVLLENYQHALENGPVARPALTSFWVATQTPDAIWHVWNSKNGDSWRRRRPICQAEPRCHATGSLTAAFLCLLCVTCFIFH